MPEEDPGFSLIPPDTPVSADDALAAAEASRVESTFPDPTAETDPPIPFGKTALFDFATGRMVRAGGAPVYVTGKETVKQYVLMVAHSARYAHDVFSEEFGMEEPDSVIGEAADAMVAAADWTRRFEEACLVHDRIAGLEGLDVQWFPEIQTMFIPEFTVVTDEEEDGLIPVGPVAVSVEVEGG